jgi:hypothetical protein
MTVPAFGDWDMKNGALPDYSMDFSKIREMRKQNKKELSRASLGGDEDLPTGQQRSQPQAKAPTTLGRPVDDHRPAHDNPPTVSVTSFSSLSPTSKLVTEQRFELSATSILHVTGVLSTNLNKQVRTNQIESEERSKN